MMKEAIEALKSGKTILYPSDTIWGLGCDATNEAACERILELKNRPEQKSFIVLVDGWRMLEKYVPEFHEICYDLADLADKPLTIIYPGARGLAKSVVNSDGSVGIRITKDPLCLALIRALNKPLVSTSANISGQPFAKRFDEIPDSIKSGVDQIVHERLTDTMDRASQIIRIGLNGEVSILRH